MAFDLQKIITGVAFYASVVAIPTVHIVFEYYHISSVILERVTLGILSVITMRLIWQGFRGEPGPADPGDPTKYFGLNIIPLVAALALLYAAWVSNIPQRLGGTVDGGIFVFTDHQVLRLGTIWQRIITSLLTYTGLAVLFKYAIRTTKTHEERRTRRAERRQTRRMRRLGIPPEAADPLPR